MKSHHLLGLAFFDFVYLGAAVAAVPIVLLRVLGGLFFLTTTPVWAYVPAAVLAALVAIAYRPFAGRRALAALCLALYVTSLTLHGWEDMHFRLEQGGDAMLDLIEAGLILVLLLRSMVPTSSNAATTPA